MKIAAGLVLLLGTSAASSMVSADDVPPTTPTLTYSIYSSSAAELFWSRSTDDSVVLVYTLERDGETVYEGDGLSHFEDDLVDGQQYSYELTVTGEDSLTSTPVTISFSTSDEPPIDNAAIEPPKRLRADIYSSSALELFWGRVHGEALNYLIRQDGMDIGSTNGTSFFVDSGIAADGIYRFSVTATKDDPEEGLVSAEASIDVDIAQRTTTPTEMPPNAPENVSFARYSSTAAELFWDRAPADENVVATDVYRDGVLIATVRGTSYYDDSREEGRQYEYQLIAINGAGARSAPATFSESAGPEEPEEFTIDERNLEYFIDNVARIVNGLVFNDLVDKAFDISRLTISGLEVVSTEGNDIVTTVYDCEGGGQLTNVVSRGPVIDSEDVIFSDFSNMTLNNCTLGLDTYDGILAREFSDLPYMEIITMAELERTYPNGDSTTISGSWRNDSPSVDELYSTLTVSQYFETNADGTDRPVTDYSRYDVFVDNGVSDDSYPLNLLESNWTASGPFSDDLSITARTTSSFETGNSRETSNIIVKGTLVLDVGGLLQATIDADSGSLDSFLFIVEQGDITTSYDVAWDDENRFRF